MLAVTGVVLSCDKPPEKPARPVAGDSVGAKTVEAVDKQNRKLEAALLKAGIPADLAGVIRTGEAAFLHEAALIINADAGTGAGAGGGAASGHDPFLYRLIDKTHPLPEGYEPADLVPLVNGAYRVSRAGLSLRKKAEVALTEMAAAAARDGVTLVVSSSYRSHRPRNGTGGGRPREFTARVQPAPKRARRRFRFHFRRIRGHRRRKMACEKRRAIRLEPFISRRLRSPYRLPLGELALPLCRETACRLYRRLV